CIIRNYCHRAVSVTFHLPKLLFASQKSYFFIITIQTTTMSKPFSTSKIAYLIVLATLLSIGGCASTQKTINKPDDETVKKDKKFKPYHSVITSEAKTDRGFVTVHHIGEKYYFEIPDSLLGRDMLLISR